MCRGFFLSFLVILPALMLYLVPVCKGGFGLRLNGLLKIHAHFKKLLILLPKEYFS